MDSTTLKGIFTRLQPQWADLGDRGQVVSGIRDHLGWRVESVKRPSQWGRYPVDGEPSPLLAFPVLSRRWVVERSVAWLGRYWRMRKEYEYLTASREALIYAAMSRLRLRRLTKLSVRECERGFPDTLYVNK